MDRCVKMTGALLANYMYFWNCLVAVLKLSDGCVM